MEDNNESKTSSGSATNTTSHSSTQSSQSTGASSITDGSNWSDSYNPTFGLDTIVGGRDPSEEGVNNTQQGNEDAGQHNGGTATTGGTTEYNPAAGTYYGSGQPVYNPGDANTITSSMNSVPPIMTTPVNEVIQAGTTDGGSSNYQGFQLWGLTYSPYNDDGSCPDVSTVAAQLKTIAAVTNNIRLYSTDCSQLSSVLQANSQYNIGLKVHAGIWTSDGASRMQAELDQFVAAVKQYGSSCIKGVSVGNEEISKGVSESTIISNINQVRARLQAEGLDGIPVYTTEQDATFTSDIAQASDLVQINVYTIFDGSYSNIDASVQSVIQRVNNVRANVAGSKKVRIGETGWSSAGYTGPSPLTLVNEIAYLKKFKCAASSAGLEYFYFEAKDALWKRTASISEQNFGIFDYAYRPKFDFGALSSCN
ncbi:hypothetical protein GGI07_000646 [Coemansia sp. Benny D115]|nr:hypothetical protein GGI07_000646 [Coemansia sp. Benny D115]